MQAIATRILPDDAELLRQFVDGASDEAFRQLVDRHVSRVYGTARRLVRDSHLAEDVTQAVFILLARKSRGLPRDVILPAWLHRVTYLTSSQALRTLRRMRKHERQAAQMHSDESQNQSHPENAVENPPTELLTQIDVALAQLGDTDRSAIILRFMQSMPLARVGHAIGLSESAAAKRVSRALGKLRSLLSRKGIRLDENDLPPLLMIPPVAAPAALATKAAGISLAVLKGTGVAGSAAALAKGVVLFALWTKIKIAALAAVVLLVIACTVALVFLKFHRATDSMPVAQLPTRIQPSQIAAPKPQVAALSNDLSFQAIAVSDPALAGYPYAPGWPRVLPGAIFSSPVLADLEGSGKLDIVVTCAPSFANEGFAAEELPSHPKPNPSPLLFALRPDGTVLPGWPLTIGRANQAKPPHTSPWVSSPSVFRASDGKDGLVVRGPGGAPIFIFKSDRSFITVPSGNPAVSVPLADFAGTGVMDFSVGKALATVEGKPVPGWPAAKMFKRGFAPCVGDIAGDGNLGFYHLFYQTKGTNVQDLIGYDVHGNPLPGWPRQVEDPIWEPPVMGDVAGDGKMEIIIVTAHHLYGWTWDGKPLPNTTSDGQLVGIIRADVQQYSASPALADLDGDGKAEIIIYDDLTHAIRAWHGDGRPFGIEKNSPPTTQPDGIIAHLPSAHGVSVVTLGDDPRILDFFAGTYWVRLFPTGKTIIKNMIPDDDANTEWNQPTIADVEGNGKADVIFGLTNGRLFVYQTGLAYHPQYMQWPTAQGNFQHTGAWHRRVPTSQP